MRNDEDDLSLKELCDESGVSERTIRYYMANGILPPAPRSGPGVRYPRTHLARLELIRRWQEEGLPLEQIRKLIGDLDEVEVERLHVKEMRKEMREVASAPEVRSSAADYVQRVLGKAGAPPSPRGRASEPDDVIQRAHWERYAIDEDIEIHVRRPLSHPKNRRVEALVREARRIMKEKLP